MSNILTISLLKLLSDSDLTALGKYLQSPFFSNKKALYPLFLELRNSGNPPYDAREMMFKRVFKKDSFDSHKWNKALSDLNSHIENFIAIRHLQNTPELLQQVRIDAFFEKEDESLIEDAVQAVIQPPSSKPAPEKTDDWELRFWSRKRLVSYRNERPLQELNTILDQLETDLDTYYLLSKIQVACNRISAARFLKQSSPFAAAQSLLEQAKPLLTRSPSHLLILYSNLLGLLLESDTSFPHFFALLQKHGPLIDRRELETIVRFGFNYCIHIHRTGKEQALSWYLSLYTWANSNGVFTKASSEELFLNLGVLFARTKHETELDTLLKTGINTLPSSRREGAANLLAAYRLFYKGEHGNAQKALALVAIRHPRYALMRHSLALRNAVMLMEKEEFAPQQVIWATQKFEEFLTRQKTFAESFCQSYRDMIWFVERLALGDMSSDLMEEALQKKQPAARDWIAAMIGRLPH